MEWVSQITTVVAEMVVPGLAGQWLDKRWGTGFLTLLGFALGLSLGIWHLIAMTRPRGAGRQVGGTGAGSNSESGIGPSKGNAGIDRADGAVNPQSPSKSDPSSRSDKETD
jgi:hypothetical protein